MTPNPDRSPAQGVLTIVRLNWPMYLAALLVLVASSCGIVAASGGLRLAASMVAIGCAWFLVGSLVVSFVVYDRSRLYRWEWLDQLLGDRDAADVIVCHTGFDEISDALRKLHPGWRIRVLDHFDPGTMTEPSIRRARKFRPPRPDDVAARFDQWPEIEGDVILGVLAIHELRSECERTRWFSECRHHLRVNGSVVIVEHVRDPANFLAFGPGFLHFHAVGSWRRCWEAAGFRSPRQFRITPFVRVFFLS